MTWVMAEDYEARIRGAMYQMRAGSIVLPEHVADLLIEGAPIFEIDGPAERVGGVLDQFRKQRGQGKWPSLESMLSTRLVRGLRTYYVDANNGADGNSGSAEFPWKTLQPFADLLRNYPTVPTDFLVWLEGDETEYDLGPLNGEVMNTVHHSVNIRGRETVEVITGTATGGTSLKITDSTKSWTQDDYMNMFVEITSDDAIAGEYRLIESNDSTNLNLAQGFSATVSAGMTYRVFQPSAKLVMGGVPITLSASDPHSLTIGGLVISDANYPKGMVRYINCHFEVGAKLAFVGNVAHYGCRFTGSAGSVVGLWRCGCSTLQAHEALSDVLGLDSDTKWLGWGVNTQEFTGSVTPRSGFIGYYSGRYFRPTEGEYVLLGGRISSGEALECRARPKL